MTTRQTSFGKLSKQLGIGNDDLVTKAEQIIKAADEDGDGVFTKSELDKFLLFKVGLKVNETVLNGIFNECDKDHSGNITSQELITYLKGIKEPHWNDAMIYTIKSCLLSSTWWACLLFAIACITAFVLHGYHNRDLHPTDTINIHGFQAILFLLGCFVFVFLIYDEHQKDIELLERVISKISIWAKNHADLDDSFQMDVIELNKILERSSIFLPSSTLMEVFELMDNDESGSLTFGEIKEFADAYEKRGPLVGLRLAAATLQRCLVDSSFYSMWGFVIGCVFFIYPSYRDEHSRTLYIVGSYLFLFPAVDCLRLDVVGEFKNLRKERELQCTILKRFHLDSNSGSEQELKESQSKVFESLDASYGGDGKIDFLELYDGFTSAGIVVEIDTLRSIFKEADPSGDGKISLDEFMEYVESLKQNIENYSAKDDTQKVITTLFRSHTFFINVQLVIAGALFVVGSQSTKIPGERVSNIFLAGYVMYFYYSCYYFYDEIVNNINTFYTNALARYKFKLAFIKMINESGNDIEDPIQEA